jgi:hypothetical protein
LKINPNLNTNIVAKDKVNQDLITIYPTDKNIQFKNRFDLMKCGLFLLTRKYIMH